jgi:hypothetical protein
MFSISLRIKIGKFTKEVLILYDNDHTKMHIGIAGNIGSGKTTLTRKLAEHYGWTPKYEAVTYNPYLEDYYKDIPRWSYNLETYFLAQRFQDVLEIAKSRDVIIQDRTLFEGVEIFVDCGIASGADVFKALALGAKAVGVGRAMMPALVQDGTEGVVRCVTEMNRELRTLMNYTGCADPLEIGPDLLWKDGKPLASREGDLSFPVDLSEPSPGT